MLATACDLTNIVYGRLAKEFIIDSVIIEEPVSKKLLLKRRIKKTGLLNVAGQLLFMLFVAKPLRFLSVKRKKEILANYHLTDKAIPLEKIKSVASVNDPETIKLIQTLQPDLVIVNGTRIISVDVINCTNARFINIHAGITPLYRGVHGAYWAMAMEDKAHCGVTIHYVDSGIDTGGILAQGIIQPDKTDNFTTYPYLQFAVGVELFSEVIRDFMNGILQEKPVPKGNSNLWYHPTIIQYIRFRLFRGAK